MIQNLILILVFGIATFTAVFMTPALPQIATDFQISSAHVSWMMTIFLIGYALGMLPYGPLANRFGRKRALTIGVVIALIGTLLGCFAHSFPLLLVARFLQAVGTGAGFKIVFTMIGDMHSGEKAAKSVALLTLSFGVIPIVSTIIAGYVVSYISWRGGFVFLAFYIVLVWLLSRLLPETAKEIRKDALQIKKIGSGYLEQFKNPHVTLHAFFAGVTTAAFYIFVTISPYIAIDRIGLAPDQFGLWMMIPSIGVILGALFSRSLSAKNPFTVMLFGILIFFVSTTTQSILFISGIVNVYSLFIPPLFMYIGNNLIWSRAQARGLSGASDKANGSAVMQFISLTSATLGVFAAQSVAPTATLLLPCAFGIITLLLFTVWLNIRLRTKH